MNHPKREEFAQLIVSRITQEKDKLAKEFSEEKGSVKTRHFYIDDLLPESLCQQIYESFPDDASKWRKMESFRERKLTSKDFDAMPSILKEITFAIQDENVLKAIEEITGIKNQYPDPTLYAGGLSSMGENDFLNPHIDNSHNQERTQYRTVNLLYYVTPEWKREDGGHLELWDKKVKENVTIESRFNRLVIMETNKTSWHSVSPVVARGRRRCCVSNYYFSPDSQYGHEYFHITAFHGRPEQKMRRIASRLDAFMRTAARKVFRKGLGKKDIYQQSAQN